MSKIFVDTNYFLRLLLKDNSTQQKIVEALFEQAVDGKVKLFSNTLVVFEIYWVMINVYKKSKTQTVKAIQNLLKLAFISIEERELMMSACRIYDQIGLELEDCYHLVYAQSQQAKKLATFDKKLQKVSQEYLNQPPGKNF